MCCCYRMLYMVMQKIHGKGPWWVPIARRSARIILSPLSQPASRRIKMSARDWHSWTLAPLQAFLAPIRVVPSLRWHQGGVLSLKTIGGEPRSSTEMLGLLLAPLLLSDWLSGADVGRVLRFAPLLSLGTLPQPPPEARSTEGQGGRRGRGAVDRVFCLYVMWKPRVFAWGSYPNLWPLRCQEIRDVSRRWRWCAQN